MIIRDRETLLVPCLAIGAQFGMTASSRKRHGWEVQKGERELDDFERLIQMRGTET